MTTVLNREDLKRLLQCEPPLVEGLVNVEEQLQPNGIDLTLRQVSVMQTPGQLAVSNGQRVVSCQSPLVFDGLGLIQLAAGIYSITFNEVIHLPPDVMALATPRSSLLRCGVTVHTAVWDAGYSGRSESLLVVYHPQGIKLQRDARIIQLVFFQLSGKTQGYKGIYQGENIE